MRCIALVGMLLMTGCRTWVEGPPLPENSNYVGAEGGLVPPLEPGTILLPPGASPNFGQVPFDPQASLGPGAYVAPNALQPNPGFSGPPGLQNPLFVPVYNHNAAWETIVDVMNDYFRIAKEERVHEYEGIVTEGRIQTYPQGGATILEPHRGDSVGSFERLQSTFQTIRRTANLRVVPTQGGYLLEMVVVKELEDLPRPENATSGAATFRADGSLMSRRSELVSKHLESPRWISIGRDPALEQQLLLDLRSRLDPTPFGVVQPPTPVPSSYDEG